jgi:adenine-specific DNA-methyltransferase
MSEEKKPKKRLIETYEHTGKKRLNNPPVGLVTPDTDPEEGERRRIYAYDPHLDPQLQWSGKAEHTSFKVPTVSLHVHERIDPRTIIDNVRKRGEDTPTQLSLFQTPEQNPPLRQAVEFYKHAHGWSNRMIAGDSLLVMNSLLEKEGMAGKVQMIYVDPPYGIKYGSNFQPFVNRREVKDGKDEDLTGEPEQIQAFRDTWELGIHSYLSYLRDRLLLSREMLSDSGSVFVQISDENVHHVRELLDEIFGKQNFVLTIIIKKKSATMPTHAVNDFLLWYAKNRELVKVRQLFYERSSPEDDSKFNTLISPKKAHKRTKNLSIDEIKKLTNEGWRWARVNYPIVSQHYSETRSRDFHFAGKYFSCGMNCQWRFGEEGLRRLAKDDRLFDGGGNSLGGIVYWDDWPYVTRSNIWDDVHGEPNLIYVVQTSYKIATRCILMTTDPGDLVFDPTCGSGTTAFVSEQWGRRWMTCDTSRVALTLARQRLMTAIFDFYQLARPSEGVGSGFIFKTVPHITLKSIANKEPAKQEVLYDQPVIDSRRLRVSGPFTVEAVPAPSVKSLEQTLKGSNQPADISVARSGETLRQSEWRDELLKTGIRGKGGQYIHFSRLEPLPGCRWLQADGETKANPNGKSNKKQFADEIPMRIAVSFGPEHAPLEPRQVGHAIEEAQTLVPKPKLIVFAAFQFDPEASKDIDELNWPGVTLLKAQMNADLLTDDLKKKRTSNDSFWLIGQPDARLQKLAKNEHKGKYQITVEGFDYYNVRTGEIDSGGSDRISAWMLDTDYDGRSLYPRQVFFPMAGEKDGWTRLAKNLKAEIDEDLIEAYRGTISLPFEPGPNKRIAIKIVDDRGIESLKVMEVL